MATYGVDVTEHNEEMDREFGLFDAMTLRRSESVLTLIKGRVAEDATETLTDRYVVEYSNR